MNWPAAMPPPERPTLIHEVQASVIDGLQCHLCLDLLDLGIIDADELRPAVVVKPQAGSLCSFHRKWAAFGFKTSSDQRDELRADLRKQGYLPPDPAIEEEAYAQHGD